MGTKYRSFFWMGFASILIIRFCISLTSKHSQKRQATATMKGKKIEKLLSSIVQSQLDNDHVEKLEKNEEGKVEKILKLITAQDKDELSSDERQELISYIKGLSTSYEYLNERYDLLMEKLQNVSKHKKVKGGRSSESSNSNESSDSEANEFFTPRKIFHVNTELETHNYLRSPLTRSDTGSQQSEIQVASKLAERESTIMGLLDDLRHYKDMVSKLETKNANTLLELEEFIQEKETMKDMLGKVQKEKEELLLEKSRLLEKLHASEEFNRNLTSEKDSLKGDILKLENKIAQLLNDLNESSRDKEEATKDIAIPEKLQTTENDIDEMEKEVEKLREKISSLEKNVNVLCDSKYNLECKLEGRDNEILVLQKQLLDLKTKKSIANEPTVSHANNLQQEINSLRSQYDLEEQATFMAEKISEGMIVMGKLECELISKISTQMTQMDKQQDTFDRITNYCRLLKDEIDQKKLDEIETMETIRQLKAIQEDQEKNLSRLQDDLKEALSKLKHTETQKLDVDKEVKKLKEHNETLEVHLRLLDQKLKITKSEFKEKDENHKKKIKDLQERYQKLDGQCESLYAEIHCVEDELMKIKGGLKADMEEHSDIFQDMDSIFKEKCGCFMRQLSKFVEELRIARKDLGTVVSNTLEMENEKLKEEMRNIEEKLSKKEKEKEGIEKNMLELEQRVKEKEEEGKYKDEEKREAIRQLCLSIEYHREIYNHLLENFSEYRKRTISSR